jgi:hypothetical protein
MESVAGIVAEGAVDEVSPTRAACSAAGGYVTGLVASVAVLLTDRALELSVESVFVEGFNRPLVESFE